MFKGGSGLITGPPFSHSYFGICMKAGAESIPKRRAYAAVHNLTQTRALFRLGSWTK